MLEVCCAIVRHEGKVLAAQRSTKMSHARKWEFPGGKIRKNESAAEALVREMQEELSMELKLEYALPLSTYSYPHVEIRLHPFVCSWKNLHLEVHEHAQIRWCTLPELRQLDWVAADIEVLKNYAISLSQE